MIDHKQRRLELLRRLRQMHVEQARAGHVTALSELDERRGAADDTERRMQALDEWALARLAGGAPLPLELLRQTELFRGMEKLTLEQQRALEAESRQRAESARGELARKFEELSAAERLAIRHGQSQVNEKLRRSYAELDEAGVQSKLETKE